MKTGDQVEIAEVDSVHCVWHGMRGRIVNVCVELKPFPYLVRVENGVELYMKEHEIRKIERRAQCQPPQSMKS